MDELINFYSTWNNLNAFLSDDFRGNTRKQIHSNLLNPLTTNPTKWPNTPKQFVGEQTTNYLGVFGHFMGLLVKGLIIEVKFGHDPLIPQKSSEHTTIWSSDYFKYFWKWLLLSKNRKRLHIVTRGKLRGTIRWV